MQFGAHSVWVEVLGKATTADRHLPKKERKPEAGVAHVLDSGTGLINAGTASDRG